jgi:hypothetical protein
MGGRRSAGTSVACGVGGLRSGPVNAQRCHHRASCRADAGKLDQSSRIKDCVSHSPLQDLDRFRVFGCRRSQRRDLRVTPRELYRFKEKVGWPKVRCRPLRQPACARSACVPHLARDHDTQTPPTTAIVRWQARQSRCLPARDRGCPACWHRQPSPSWPRSRRLFHQDRCARHQSNAPTLRPQPCRVARIARYCST